MILVHGTARARPGTRDGLVAAAGVVTAATISDDGCLDYGFYADTRDPDVLLGLEVWRDQRALDAHLAHDHTTVFMNQLPDLIDGDPVVSVLHVQHAGDGDTDERDSR